MNITVRTVLIVFAAACFLAAALDFFPARATAVGLFLLALSFLVA